MKATECRSRSVLFPNRAGNRTCRDAIAMRVKIGAKFSFRAPRGIRCTQCAVGKHTRAVCTVGYAPERSATPDVRRDVSLSTSAGEPGPE